MIIDGKALSEKLFEEIQKRRARIARPLSLGVLVQGNNPPTLQFVALKKRRAEKLNITFVEEHCAEHERTEELVEKVMTLSRKTDGVVVQLPLSASVDRNKVLNAIPLWKDIDVLSSVAISTIEKTPAILPPVVFAIMHIIEEYGVMVRGKKVIVVGEGLLVGMPSAKWFASQGAQVVVCADKEKDIASFTKQADIIVLGAGVPHLLTPDMIPEGVAIFDAGASEEGGMIVGDADPACAHKASIFTPVPGGIGPLTVAALFHNLLVIAEKANIDVIE